MEPILIEFLIGVIVGTIPALVITTRMTSKTALRKRDHLRDTVRQSTRHRTRLTPLTPTAVPRQLKNRDAKPASTSKELLTVELKANGTVEEIPKKEATAILYSCPTCGLEASERILAEHFLGSPGHQHGPVIPEPPAIGNKIEEDKRISPQDDPGNSLRSLLQMLVPPRAFGRRHAQRTVDPLAQLVENMRSSRGAGFGS
jgi:hypothetical protein